jgi:Family of unknown function (DUF6522)
VRLLLLNQANCDTVKHFEDGFVADRLGLLPDVFWREIKHGGVYSVVERGEGDDAGRMHTFRYRARSWSMTLEETVE